MSAFMDTKKSHEVDIMSYVCVHLFKSTGCQLVSTGQYYTIIDFNEVDIRIYLPEKVIIHRGR